MRDLLEDTRKQSKLSNRYKYPVPLPSEVRKKWKICPKNRWTVSVFSCLQCTHFDIFDLEYIKRERHVGKCLYLKGRRPSKGSRKMTSAFRDQVTPPQWRRYYDKQKARKAEKDDIL